MEDEEVMKMKDEEVMKIEDEEVTKIEDEEVMKMEDEEVTKMEDEEATKIEDEETNVDPAIFAVLPKGCKITLVEQHGKTNWSLGYKLEALLPDQSRKAYFMKVVDRDLGLEMVLGEYEGQKALKAVIPDNIPKPLAYGTFTLDSGKHFYLTEFHDMRARVPRAQQLISTMKQLHNDSVSPNGKFGFHVMTYKGYFPLQTAWCDSWEEFFGRQFRTELAWETSVRGQSDELDALVENLYQKVIPRLLLPLQTGGRSIKPTLCHGDLWQGNVEIDINTQKLILFDSCTVYAHNEFDLSLCRAPRYRLNKSHVDEYKMQVEPSEPKGDFDDRNALYALRNDIVVSALWKSRSELRGLVMEEMRRLIDKYPEGIDGLKDEE